MERNVAAKIRKPQKAKSLGILAAVAGFFWRPARDKREHPHNRCDGTRRADPAERVVPVEIVCELISTELKPVYPQVNAIVRLLAADTLKAAKTAETAVVSGDELGAFHGVPFTIKDVVDTAGLQWGHVLSDVETTYPEILRLRRCIGFNGATSSRTWKLPFRKSLA